MEKHDCVHETDIAIMASKVENTEKTVQKIYQILTGNGETGLVTQTALQKQSIGRLWWFVGVLVGVLLGSACYIIRGGIA